MSQRATALVGAIGVGFGYATGTLWSLVAGSTGVGTGDPTMVVDVGEAAQAKARDPVQRSLGRAGPRPTVDAVPTESTTGSALAGEVPSWRTTHAEVDAALAACRHALAQLPCAAPRFEDLPPWAQPSAVREMAAALADCLPEDAPVEVDCSEAPCLIAHRTEARSVPTLSACRGALPPRQRNQIAMAVDEAGQQRVGVWWVGEADAEMWDDQLFQERQQDRKRTLLRRFQRGGDSP